MSSDLEARVAGALTNVRNPRLENDILSAGMVQDLVVNEDGSVSFTFVLAREDPAALVRAVRRAIRDVDGVTDVKLRIVEPRAAESGAGPTAGGMAAERPPATQPQQMDHLGRVIAVSSGKGGVGKSTVTANVAASLSAGGHSVGVMDADIYGPNIPRMFGVNEKPPVRGRTIIPLESHGVKLMSLGFLVERDQAAIFRGPIIMKILQQFLRDVDWGNLDYFFVDLPPGTGDAQLSLVQTVHVQTSIIVTTPQKMATGDGLRGAKMFERVNVPVMGVVENMSYFVCPDCGTHTEVFRSGGGQQLADELDVPLLGRVPLQAHLTDLADEGKLVVLEEPDSPAALALAGVAAEVKQRTAGRTVSLPVITG